MFYLDNTVDDRWYICFSGMFIQAEVISFIKIIRKKSVRFEVTISSVPIQLKCAKFVGAKKWYTLINKWNLSMLCTLESIKLWINDESFLIANSYLKMRLLYYVDIVYDKLAGLEVTIVVGPNYPSLSMLVFLNFCQYLRVLVIYRKIFD